MASEKPQRGATNPNGQQSPIQRPSQTSARAVVIVIMAVLGGALLTILAGFLRQQCAPQKPIPLPTTTLLRTPPLAAASTPSPIPSPTPSPRITVDPSHRCVGYWTYVPKNLEAEVGFSIRVPALGKAKLQFSDYGSIVGEPRSFGDPTLVRTSDTRNPTDVVFFNCSPNGQVTSAIVNGRSYLLRRTKGDIFDAERARGRAFDD